MKIKDISGINGREVVTVKPHSPLSEAIKKLMIHKIGAMPVCDLKGALLGIISERDIMRWIHRGNTDTAKTEVKDIMTYKVITADLEDDLVGTLKKMMVNGIRHLPVMGSSRVVGMLSLRDIIAEQIKEQSTQADILKEFIAGGYN
jgi:CBS domain-containing protein